MDFDRFWLVILIFLEFWGFGEHVQVSFSLVFEFLFCWGILLGRVSFLFGQHKTKKPTTITITWGLVDRGGGIWDFQHCIVITRGQEERIPKTASVVGTNFGLRSFCLCLCVFILLGNFAGSCFRSFWSAQNKKNNQQITWSLVDR